MTHLTLHHSEAMEALAPERIMIAGDWHGDVEWACDAIEHAAEEGCAAIVQLGDFGYKFSRRFLAGLEWALERTSLTLAFVDGNHDDHDWLGQQPIEGGVRRLTSRVWHLPRGARWTWGDVRFLAVGGAVSIDKSLRREGVSWWASERISDQDVTDAISGGMADVLLSHDRPARAALHGIDDVPEEEVRRRWTWARPEDLADARVSRRQLQRIADATRPRRIWHGHYHMRAYDLVDMGWGDVGVKALAANGSDWEDTVEMVRISDLAEWIYNRDLSRLGVGSGAPGDS